MNAVNTELRHYLRLARRSLWLLVICPLVAAASAFAFTRTLPPVYEAHVSLLVRPAQVLATDANGAYSSSDQISATYASLMLKRPLMQKVVSDLGMNTSPEELGSRVRVSPEPNTTILDVAVSDSDPGRAATIANTLTVDFIGQMKDIQAADAGSQPGRYEDNLVVVQPATAPSAPTAPKPLNNSLYAAAAVLALTFVVVLLRDYLDQSIKSDDEVEHRIGLSVLGHIPFTTSGRGRLTELVMLQEDSPAAEAYRTLRTNVVFSAVDARPRLVVVTSAAPGEGKSRTASNLALTLAQAGYRTVLVDADFRRPSQHRNFGIMRNTGLSNVVVEDAHLDSVVVASEEVPNLSVLPSGPTPPNPSELLGSVRTRAALEQLRLKYSYVVIDTPPINAVTDASVVASHADAVVLVAESRRTTYAGVKHARESIERVKGRVIGVVINKVRADRTHEYYDGYYGYPYPSRPRGATAENSAQ